MYSNCAFSKFYEDLSVCVRDNARKMFKQEKYYKTLRSSLISIKMSSLVKILTQSQYIASYALFFLRVVSFHISLTSKNNWIRLINFGFLPIFHFGER